MMRNENDTGERAGCVRGGRRGCEGLARRGRGTYVRQG